MLENKINKVRALKASFVTETRIAKATKAVTNCDFKDEESVKRAHKTIIQVGALAKHERSKIYEEISQFYSKSMIHESSGLHFIEFIDYLEGNEVLSFSQETIAAMTQKNPNHRRILHYILTNYAHYNTYILEGIVNKIVINNENIDVAHLLHSFNDKNKNGELIFNAFMKTIASFSNGSNWRIGDQFSIIKTAMLSPFYTDKIHLDFLSSHESMSSYPSRELKEFVLRTITSRVSPALSFDTVNKLGMGEFVLTKISIYPEIAEKAKKILINGAGWDSNLPEDWYVKTCIGGKMI